MRSRNPLFQAIFFILTGSVLIGSLANYFNLSAQSDSENPPLSSFAYSPLAVFQSNLDQPEAVDLPSTTIPPTQTVTATPTATAVSPATATLTPSLTPQVVNRFYLSKLGDNRDGLSWESAWNELDQIDWSIIGPGDLIYLDGGADQMVYTSTLQIEQSGTEGAPITIMLSAEPGRDGKALFFGGRDSQLPHCDQTEYQFQESLHDWGIVTGGDPELPDTHHSWLIIDGRKWGGIGIRGYRQAGLRLERNSSHITVRNLEIFDNGIPYQADDGRWRPTGPGVQIGGHHHLLEHLLIYDNGHDALQSMNGNDNNLGHITLRRSWLYNSRPHPENGGLPFNVCAHTDGFQIYAGGTVSHITLESSIIGPGFMQGVLFGQSETGGNSAQVDHVILRDLLLVKATHNNIMGYPGIESKDWMIERVTAHCPTTAGYCLYLEGDGHVVTESIFLGADGPNGTVIGPIALYNGSDTEENCQYPYDIAWPSIGDIERPSFVSVSDGADKLFDLTQDYTVVGESCAGRGSTVTTPEQLWRE